MIISRNFKTMRFDVNDSNVSSRTRSGFVTSVFISDPYWVAEYRLDGLRDSEYQKRYAEIYAAIRSKQVILGWDTFDRTPPLSGNVFSTSENLVTISGLPVGAEVPTGAKISDENNVLCMVQYAATVNSSTNVTLRLSCLPSGYILANNVKIGSSARCAMTISPNSLKASRKSTFNSISFMTQQVFA